MRVNILPGLKFGLVNSVSLERRVMRKVISVVSAGAQWKVKCDHCKEETKNTQLEAIKRPKAHVVSCLKVACRRSLFKVTGGSGELSGPMDKIHFHLEANQREYRHAEN
jgi:hypothetical protein